ncbi:MAG TPA: GNAT family N-acetyltransferase [Actinopolymorphaceae bacterium]|jgi:predicted N-acetyltransferase YhbS
MRGSALVGLDGELVGFVAGHRLRWYDGWHFCIAEMAVARSRQRTGLGSQLLRTFLDSLDSLDSLDDVSGVYLLTEAHGAASSFYEGHGFRPASRQSVMTRF